MSGDPSFPRSSPHAAGGDAPRWVRVCVWEKWGEVRRAAVVGVAVAVALQRRRGGVDGDVQSERERRRRRFFERRN